MARSVLLNLIGQDRVSRVMRRVRREVEETEESVDRFNRTSSRMGRDTDTAFSRVAKSIGAAFKAGAKLASIGAGIGLALHQVAALAAELAPLAGLLAGIPAAVAVAGAAFGVLKLALSGVGDAFKAAMGDDAEKFEESLRGLAPAAKTVARELRALRPTLLGVRNAAQQAFFAPLQGQLKATAAVLAGPLRNGVRGVAREYGLAAAGALRFAREGRTASALTSVFAGTRKAIAGLRPALNPVLAGFRDMAVQGVGTLTRLAQGAGQVGARFGEWMQRFAASGGVQRALEGALGVVKMLGGLLLNIGGILNSIIQAASSQGGGLLGFLGQAVAQLNAFLKTAQAQAALRSFFATMNQLGAALAPIVPIVGSLAAALISALAPVVRALTPLLSLLVGALGQVLGSLTPILAPLSAMIVSLASGLMPILRPIIAAIAATAQQIGGALVAALTASLPSLQQIVVAVASLLPELLPLLPLFSELVLTILPVVPAVTQLAAVLIGYLVPVVRVLIQALVQYWTFVVGLLIPVFRTMVSVVQWVARTIGPLFTWLWQNAIGPALRGIAAAVVWLWQTILVPAWNGIKAVISGAWAVIKPIFNVIATVLKVVLGVAFVVLRTIVQVAWIGIATQIKIAWGVIKPIFNLIKAFVSNVLGPVFRWLLNNVIKPVWSAISTAITFVWNRGIKPAFDKLKSAVGTLGGAFKSAVSAIKTQWDKLKNVAKAPVNFVIDIYNNGIAALVNRLAKFAGVGGIGKIPRLAKGGILPGYAPGVDSLIAAVSPGEAVMRPEFTRAVGSGFILKANDVARRSGVEGVRRWLTGPDAMGGEGLAFARGGIVPGFAGRFAFGGIIGDFVRGVKDFTIGNVGKAAKGLLDKILTKVPGSGIWRDVVNAVPAWIKDTVLKWIKSKIDSFGGPGIGRAVQFARAQAGKPYVWGGVGPGGYDCSGFMSALVNVIKGRNPYSRLFTTHGFTGPRGPAGFVRGARSGFTVGVTHAGVGHMAGTLAGKVNVESRGSRGVVVGPAARGTSNGLFSTRYGLKFDDGGYLPRGLSLAYNATGSPEPVLTSAQFDALAGGAPGGRPGPLVVIEKVIVEDRADVDMVMQQIEFRLRAAGLA
ncbi:hypothetical protein [Actinomadura sp. SCN-SB]|uniref:hypothetical protein n=1 Tax=Actinomadura sp. SCN-SB TaxID=3373092 RepID=UPI003753001A